MERLVAGAAKLGINLDRAQVEQFEIYYRLLIDWNQRVNLTGITDYNEVQTRHFLDSLTVVLALKKDFNRPAANTNMIDVGTGAGFPGIPLKLVFPNIRLVLLDSTAKKTEFLKKVVQRLELQHVEVITARAEDIAHQVAYRERFNLVVARALAKLSVAAELTIPFCCHQGIAVHHKKGNVTGELAEAQASITALGGKVKEVIPVNLDELPDHMLVVIEKTAATPPKYPRRPGIPSKRPLR